eukprot:1531538-Amphidinium_carterae.1
MSAFPMDIVAAPVTTVLDGYVSPLLEPVAAPVSRTMDTVDVVPCVLSATHRTSNATLEALTEYPLFEDVVAAPVATVLDVAAPGCDIVDGLAVVHLWLHVSARWWQACLVYMAMHMHGLVTLLLEMSWVLCWSFWGTLALATSSLGPHNCSSRRRCRKHHHRAP